MSLEVKNTNKLISEEGFRFVALVYALAGTGKTLWASTAPDAGVVAVETGTGHGLLSAAGKNLEYVNPTSLVEYESICNGHVFEKKQSIIVDSLSEIQKTFVKDYALSFPRAKGETLKRKSGIPELDDYGTMGEIIRKTLRKLIDSRPHQNIIVTATEKYDKADPENGQPDTIIGPDLPGAMMLASPAMFDFVFRMRVRPMLRIPNDPRSRYMQRYLISQPDGQGSITKCRGNNPDGTGMPLLNPIEVVNLESGEGTIPWLINKIIAGYGVRK